MLLIVIFFTNAIVAAAIMKRHEGRIGVKSEGEGKGSTFLIDIPIHSFDAYMNSGNNDSVSMDSPRVIDRVSYSMVLYDCY